MRSTPGRPDDIASPGSKGPARQRVLACLHDECMMRPSETGGLSARRKRVRAAWPPTSLQRPSFWSLLERIVGASS